MRLNELVQELELHRTELDVQCEDLQHALLDAEYHRNLYRQIYELGPLPYVMTDTKGRILQMNPAATALLGRTEASTLSRGRAFQAYVAEEHADKLHLFMRQALLQKQWSKCEMTLTPKTSDPVETIIHAVPIDSGDTLLLALIDMTDRINHEQKLAESEKNLALELQKSQALHSVCSALVQTSRTEELYQQIVDAAAALMDSQAASMQMYDSDTDQLHLLAWKGFHPRSAEFWKTVWRQSKSSCAAALVSDRRINIHDAEASAFMAGSPDLEEYRRSQLRSVQSTPLVSQTGELLGILSTHWSLPHASSESALNHLDVLARLAADLIDQHRADHQLRQSEGWLSGQKEAFQAAMTGQPLQVSLAPLVRTAVEYFEGHARSAFFLADPDSATLNHIVGMSDAYARSVNGFKIGADSLSCGLATHLGQAVITPDVTIDPLWEPWRWLAQEHQYRACWSFPVRTTDGPVLGTFAIFFRDPCQPTPRDYELAAVLTHAATIIISLSLETSERAHAEEHLRESKQQLERFTEQLEQNVAMRTAELVESQHRLRALATQLNLAEQRERKRLATELHDHLQQILVLGKLTVGQAKRSPDDNPLSHSMLTKLDDLLGEALTYTRTLVVDLSPPALRDHGLAAGLKWLGQFMAKHHLHVTVTVPNDEARALSEDHSMLLFQSVRELLMNASKHSGTGEATVELVQTDSSLQVTVQDHGQGFDLAGAERVAGTPANPGVSSQFGLFSIRERMNAIGGSFTIASEPGKGTSATLALPLKTMRGSPRKTLGSHRMSADQNVEESRGEETAVRVLLVDDHAMMRQGLRVILETYADVHVIGDVGDGREALAAVEELHPHLILMDINMPNLNGIEATAHIKAQYPHVQVIGLSVNAGQENQLAMLKAGASMLLTKEFAVEQLYDTIQETMKRSSFVSRSTRPDATR